MLDVCCGYRGASRPAHVDPRWIVAAFDISAGCKPDVVADLRAMPLRSPRVDYLWISPPCQEFTATCLPWLIERRDPAGPQLGIELMKAARDLVDELRPAVWVIENVPSSVRWVPFLGPVKARTWGHVFWSNVFPLLPQVRPHKKRIPGHCSFTHWKRSVIPFDVSLAWLRAAERKLGWTPAIA